MLLAAAAATIKSRIVYDEGCAVALATDVSLVTCHTSHVTRHTSHVTLHTSHFTSHPQVHMVVGTTSVHVCGGRFSEFWSVGGCYECAAAAATAAAAAAANAQNTNASPLLKLRGT